MKIETFVYRTRINAPAEAVFRWHARPGAFERLNPPWEPVEVIERTGGIENGARVVLRMQLGPIAQQWVSEHCDYEEGRQFRDVQVAGPLTHWVHTHRVEPDGPTACYLEDHIEYTLPFGVLGRIGGGSFVRHKLERLFAYRHRMTINDVIMHAAYEGSPMNILVTGAGGLVGKALLAFFSTGGHQVTRLVRTPPRPGAAEIQWDPEAGIRDVSSLEGYDAVVHLAGENIATGRWTAEKKDRIRRSRVHGTTVLCEALARLSRPPKVLVSASAIGYYGDRGAEPLGEESSPGDGFLSEVCQAWEAATAVAARKGIRVVLLRLGVVLSPTDGALAKMLLPFKLGVGGVLGSGRQYMSWITLDDVIGAIHHAVITKSLQGPVNATTPSPVTNDEFTTTLGRVLHRPTILPVPAFAARFAFGEMADALLLASARVEPRQLLASGYTFRHPELEGAFRHILGKSSPPL